MHYYEVAPNRIIRAGISTFTYASHEKLSIGQIVLIEVGKKQVIGIVMLKVGKPTYETKAIISIVKVEPVPLQLIQTLQWMSNYYATPFATVLQTMLPANLLTNRRKQKVTPLPKLKDRTKIVLNKEQQAAVRVIFEGSSGTFLLHGITGSGKTQVYLELARRAVMNGKSVVILVPEIALTSQLVAVVNREFKNVLVTHSHQSEATRHIVWEKALSATKPIIAVGPRSALFLPLRTIGLIVVDEAHEPSYKQEQSPRYSALRVASVLGSFHNASVVFGSATPSIVDYYVATKTSRPIIKLSQSARTNTVAPTIDLIDMTKRAYFKQHRFLSNTLIEKITAALEQNKQALIFHNRRGSTATTLCESCGWTALCHRCFIPYALHADKHDLQCHICGTSQPVPTFCQVCKSTNIIHKGYGTKLIESELQQFFPNKKIVRFDSDTSKDQTLERQYEKVYRGEVDILIGTQVVAKGLDLPNLRMVGVIQADTGLALPDFTAPERTFQLLAQVIGRVGRSHHPTNVVVQTFQPTHPAIKHGLDQDYVGFYESALKLRVHGQFPPFTYLLKLMNLYKTERSASQNAKRLAEELRRHLPSHITILGPTPAFYEHQHDSYRWQLILKSPSRQSLVEALRYLPSTHWQYELDPTTLL